jgi:hypothetical protein
MFAASEAKSVFDSSSPFNSRRRPSFQGVFLGFVLFFHRFSTPLTLWMRPSFPAEFFCAQSRKFRLMNSASYTEEAGLPRAIL